MSENLLLNPSKAELEMMNALPTRFSGTENLAELRQAFDLFNQMSEQLTHSYQLLEGRVIELSGELATMSEQRMQELAEKERLADQLESLLNLMPAGVVVLDNKGMISRANPTAQQMLEHRLVGDSWRSVVKTAFSPQKHDGHEVSLVNGRLVSLNTSALDGAGQLIMLTDMTETRALQQKIARQDRLTAMGKMVASLAHQIRTPLSAAMLYAGNLARPELSENQRQKFVQKVRARLEHLEHQVRDMLIFVKGETRLVNTLRCEDFIDAFRQSIEATVTSHQAKVQTFNLCPDVTLYCNRESLLGALQNLVNNAIDACDPNDIQLEIEVRQQKAEWLVIQVTDNGPGMDATVQKQVLEPFFTTKSHGTGLGLPVVQAVAKAHKGQLNIICESGSGCTMQLALPIIAVQES